MITKFVNRLLLLTWGACQLVVITSANAQPTVTQSFSAIKNGYFYASLSKGDGMVQLTECLAVSKAANRFKNPSYQCARENVSYRCTADGSLDVIFAFDSLGECVSDRKKMQDSPEEE